MLSKQLTIVLFIKMGCLNFASNSVVLKIVNISRIMNIVWQIKAILDFMTWLSDCRSVMLQYKRDSILFLAPDNYQKKPTINGISSINIVDFLIYNGAVISV